MAANPAAPGLRALRLFLGVFFPFEGIGKFASGALPLSLRKR